MSSKEDEGGDPPADPVARAVDLMRTTAKWLVTSFGALGAALIGSLSLADIGRLDAGDRNLALVGFALGIVGVLVAMVGVSTVLTPVAVTVEDLDASDVTELTTRRSQLAGFPSLTQVRRRYLAAREDAVREYDLYLAASGHGPAVDEETGELLEEARPTVDATLAQEHLAAHKRASRELARVRPTVLHLQELGAYERVRSRFRNVALPSIVVGVLIAAMGAALFASNVTKPPSEEDEAVAAAPSAAIVTIDEEERGSFVELVGADCPLDGFGALVLDRSDTFWTLVPAEPGCRAARIELPRADGQVMALEAVCPIEGEPQGKAIAPGAQQPTTTTTTTTTLAEPEPPEVVPIPEPHIC